MDSQQKHQNYINISNNINAAIYQTASSCLVLHSLTYSKHHKHKNSPCNLIVYLQDFFFYDVILPTNLATPSLVAQNTQFICNISHCIYCPKTTYWFQKTEFDLNWNKFHLKIVRVISYMWVQLVPLILLLHFDLNALLEQVFILSSYTFKNW